MNQNTALIQEFIARKEQVLNLETRLFILVLVLQISFVLFYIIFPSRIRLHKPGPVLALSVIGVLFMQMLAINGKMGLISMYLRQMEFYMASVGLEGAVWESRALDNIIFRPCNAFTLPAGLTILLLFAQILYAFYFTTIEYAVARIRARVYTAIFGIVLVILILKSLTVDFGRKLPDIFQAPDRIIKQNSAPNSDIQ